MADVKCPKCEQVYDDEKETSLIRHQQSFCLTSPGKRRKPKPTIGLREQWLADRKKDLKP